jgi:hypothetical protein
MEPSQHYDRQVIALGKKLIVQLGCGDNSPDMLTQWMCHHIADLITRAEAAQEPDVSLARQACMEAILLLWKHRNSLPNGKRPFEEVESAVEVLAAIHHDNVQAFYFPIMPSGIKQAQSGTESDIDWSAEIHNIDNAAKQLIRYCLAQIVNATDDAALGEWLMLAQSVRGAEVDFDVVFVERLQEYADASDVEMLCLERREEAIRMQRRLAAFVAVAERIRAHLDGAIDGNSITQAGDSGK